MLRVVYVLDDGNVVFGEQLYDEIEDAEREHAMRMRGMDDLGFVAIDSDCGHELLNMNHVVRVKFKRW